MNALLKRELTDSEALIFESMQIVAGETMKLTTKQHLKALLEERSNLIATLAMASDALINAKESLAGNQKEMAQAFLQDINDQLSQCDFLERIDANWVSKVCLCEARELKLIDSVNGSEE